LKGFGFLTYFCVVFSADIVQIIPVFAEPPAEFPSTINISVDDFSLLAHLFGFDESALVLGQI